MNKTAISWCKNDDGSDGFSWNPFAGCTPISAGCRSCYAARLAATRLAHLPAYAGLATESNCTTAGKHFRWSGEVRFFHEKLDEPLLRRKPSRIFVGDMGDIALLSNEKIASIFGVMAACPHHTFFVLTKRPDRLIECFEWIDREAIQCNAKRGMSEPARCLVEAQRNTEAIGLRQSVDRTCETSWPLPNVFIGTSVSTQADADKNIPELLRIPAAKRFVSCEPLLESINLWQWTPCPSERERHPQVIPDLVHIGGESGPHARPCHVEWIRSLVRQCKDAGCLVHIKQVHVNGKCVSNMEEFPDDLRIREVLRGCAGKPATTSGGREGTRVG